MLYRVLFYFLIVICLQSVLYANAKNIKLFPSDLTSSRGTIVLEQVKSEDKSLAYSFSGNFSLQDELKKINTYYGISFLSYIPKNQWRLYYKNKYELGIGASQSSPYHSLEIDLTYSRHLGIEKQLLDLFYLGVDTRLFCLNHTFLWKKNNGIEKISGMLDVAIVDVFSLYIKLEL